MREYKPLSVRQQQSKLISQYRRKTDTTPETNGMWDAIFGIAIASVPTVILLSIIIL